MTDLMMLGSFLAGPFLTVMEGTIEFTLESLRAIGYCCGAYLWLLVLTLLVAVGIVLDKDK